MNTHSFRDAVAAYLKDRPNVWIDGEDIGKVGGKYAYRTRISNCRLELGMDIQNRVRWHDDTLKDYRVSEYKYTPKSMPAQARLFEGAA